MEYLPLKSIVRWTRGATICTPTEHNRSELSVDFDRMKESDRMMDGTLREYYIADKRSWSLSWEMIPARNSDTVDGKSGGADLEKFYKETPGEFTLSISHADIGLDYSAKVVFDSFDKTHVRRGKIDFWDVSVSMTEV